MEPTNGTFKICFKRSPEQLEGGAANHSELLDSYLKKRVPAEGGANDPDGDFKFRLGTVCCYNDRDAADIQ